MRFRARNVRPGLIALPALFRSASIRPDLGDVTQLPLISVVIPTYNWSNVLRCAIASALAQTYPRFEIVVVGDGCTDDSAQVVAAFGDDRVRWHNLQENSGSQSIPNNMGIELSRGELVAYLGHDDVWMPEHLAFLAQALLEQGADLAYSVTEEVGPPGSGYRWLRGLVTGHPWIPPSSILHRRELVEEIGPWRDYRELQVPPDSEFVDRARARGRLVQVPALTVFKFNSAYRRNSYIERPSHEQERYLRRIRSERWFLYRELVVTAITLVRADSRKLPELPTPPTPLPPGWHVTQYRRIRGLEGPAPETSSSSTPEGRRSG